jgi:polyisoprenyl-phosphate glycosyltransferase
MSVISFVIPVYRNEGTVRTTYEQIVALMRDKFPEQGYEFVLIDDGSDDGSLDEMLSIHRSDPHVKALSLSRNFGQLNAVIAGLRAVTGDATVIMSADLQDPVKLIEDMIREWQTGTKIVICYRVSREDSFAARVTSKAFYGIIRLSNPNMPAGGFDYVLMDEEPCRIFASLRDRNRFFQGDVLWLGFSTKFLPYHRQARPIGKSQWTISKKVKYFIDGLLNTSYLPIRFMSFFGVMTSLAGFFYAVVVITARLTGNMPFYGYAPIMVTILVLSGIIMSMLGVIGEYVWRIYDETRGRPNYIIKERYESAESNSVAASTEQAARVDVP